MLLQRRVPGAVVARLDDGEMVQLPEAQLPRFVADVEGAGAGPRWVWDDTTRWYPQLLAAGVRVQRCTDLRLVHRVLRRAPGVDQGLFAGPETTAWDELQPLSGGGASRAEEAPEGLFDLQPRALLLDVDAEHDRQQAALAAASPPGRLRLLTAAESAGALVAAEMTHAGLPWRADAHEALLAAELGPQPPAGQPPAVLAALLADARAALGAPSLNPDSPADLLRALRRVGLEPPDTRSGTLSQLAHPAVPLLLEHRRLSRLHAANGWRWLTEWVRDGRFRPDHLPGGVVSGRWAAQGGGALSVPAVLRPAVVADDGWRLVIADVAQLEPRVLAAVSGDVDLARAAAGGDLYQGLVDSGAVATRADAKLAVLGAMYGATAGSGGRMVEHLARRYPRAVEHLELAAAAGERGEVVSTWLGRGSPRPDGSWTQQAPDVPATDQELRERRSWGRFTRNFVVQGSAAEWAASWVALLREELWRLGDSGPVEQPVERRPHLVLFLHDEVLVHTPAELADEVAAAVRAAAERAGRLLYGEFPITFPLDVHVGRTWADADDDGSCARAPAEVSALTPAAVARAPRRTPPR
ncbi:DNA polymerase-1 [Quadrisphaera granulorum]|uniref:DNA-directed DNA polymerase n=1 Tax=Quadrisphaera granulorum TaxID=317664 RepID=A0A316A0N4_9ACTN|nr:DNA polymerase-1 [Quadrisphaera granulorum]SZE98040.1 DNA polymerase-1 [Quadrisphaera granulorum]